MGIITQTETLPAILDPENPDAEGLFHDDELHSFTCECEPCGEENTRLERMRTEWQVEMSEDERCESLETYKRERQERIDAREYSEGMAIWKKALGEDDDAELESDRPLFLPETYYPIRYIKEGKNAAGLREGLKCLSVELRYNTRANRAELNQFARGLQLMNDRIAASLRDLLATRVFSVVKPDVDTPETQTHFEDWEKKSVKDVASGKVKPLKFSMVAWADAVNVLLAKSETDRSRPVKWCKSASSC